MISWTDVTNKVLNECITGINNWFISFIIINKIIEISEWIKIKMINQTQILQYK